MDSPSLGCAGLAFGITHEELSCKGIKGRAGVIVAGWESKEAHMAFREMEWFKELFGLLEGEAKSIETLHVDLKRPVE